MALYSNLKNIFQKNYHNEISVYYSDPDVLADWFLFLYLENFKINFNEKVVSPGCSGIDYPAKYCINPKHLAWMQKSRFYGGKITTCLTFLNDLSQKNKN
jgi:hypothetical protein